MLNVRARVKRGLANFSVMIIGCSILEESIPRWVKVKSSAHSYSSIISAREGES